MSSLLVLIYKRNKLDKFSLEPELVETHSMTFSKIPFFLAEKRSQMQRWGVSRLRSYYKRIWFIQQSLLRFLWFSPDDRQLNIKSKVLLVTICLRFGSLCKSLYRWYCEQLPFFPSLHCVLIAWHLFSSNTWAMSLSCCLCYFSLYQFKSSLIPLMHLKSTFLLLSSCVLPFHNSKELLFSKYLWGFVCLFVIFLHPLHYFWLSFTILLLPSIISQLKVSPKGRHVFLISQ